ncbi:transcriptional repressor [Candidimonas humi]|uniref:Fur family transcriptional regulator n=1 Tax=Candidimonas humi TaxID=683355 RepID=A0ABV8NUX7_9BURK|nr:transcriptional repressor [Candidimonas humi]
MASISKPTSKPPGSKVASQLEAAQAHCRAQGSRLTAQRKEIYELLLRRGGSAKAYDLQDDMRERHGRVAPSTVYRALEFLMAQHLVHRVDALNTFVACTAGHSAHHPLLLVCSRCQSVTELQDDAAYEAVRSKLRQAGSGFVESDIEVKGVCGKCLALERPAGRHAAATAKG